LKGLATFFGRYLFAIVSCVYLFTFGVVSGRNRGLISTISAHFGYAKNTTAPIIPQVEVQEVVPEDVVVQIRELAGVDGNVSPVEIIVIDKLVKHYNPSKLFEIGTFDGRTTLNMAANCSPEATIYTLDLPKDELNSTKLSLARGDKIYINKETSGVRYLDKDCASKITQLYGDSAIFDFSPFLNLIDFVFIDGSHSYEYVLSDSKQALKLLKDKKGVIVWHDYASWDGVTDALNELYSKDSEFKDLKHIKGTSLVYLVAR